MHLIKYSETITALNGTSAKNTRLTVLRPLIPSPLVSKNFPDKYEPSFSGLAFFRSIPHAS